MFASVLNFVGAMISYLFNILYQDWIYLFLSILIAVGLAVYIDSSKLRSLLIRKSRFMIAGSVGFGALTPLCACGTMAVVLSLLTSALPWGPIMAFLVSSPLMSPDTFVLLSGFVGMQFALVLAFASLILGLGAGFLSAWMEKKTRFFDAQLRISNPVSQAGNSQYSPVKTAAMMVPPGQLCINKKAIKLYTVMCGETTGNEQVNIACCASESKALVNRLEAALSALRIKKLLLTFWELGFLKVLPLFSLFILIAYIIKVLVPAHWILDIFGGNHFYSVPLAAIVGLPLYISDATVIPLLQVLKDAGASHGAMLAFMIAGPGTSLGVIGGLSVIMKRRAILLYTAFILFGAIALGYCYDIIAYFF